MMAESNFETIGELIFADETITMQFAVPPLISGPYEGIQLTSFPSSIAAYAII